MKRNRSALAVFLVVGILLALTACGSQKTESKAEEPVEKEVEKPAETGEKVEAAEKTENIRSLGTVVLYSPHNADLLNDGAEQFMQKYPGIRVEVVVAGTEELMNRIKTESSQPVADVLWGVGADYAAAYKEYFAPYLSAGDANIPAMYKDADHLWTGESPLPVVLFYHRELLEKAGLSAPQSWEDLLQPEWQGKIAYCVPEKSGLAYTQLCTMLFGHGGVEAGWEFVRQFYAGVSGKMVDMPSQCHKLVAAGEYLVGITSEKAALRYAGEEKLAFTYPADGTSAVPECVALIKNAPNAENAKLFLDFITSAEWQQRQSEKWHRRPVREDVEGPAGVKKMGEIPLVEYDINWAAAHKEEVLTQFNDMAAQAEKAEGK